jgi:hypothetical protein
VNVAICAVTGGALGVLTGEWLGLALPNPLSMDGVIHPEVAGSWLMMTLFFLNWLSLVLLLFNLLPMFPFDGGRLLQALAWPRMGYVRSMRLSLRVGYFGAILLFVLGVVRRDVWLCGIAFFGGLTCYQTHKQLEFTEEVMGFEYDEYALRLEREMYEKATATAPRLSRRKQRRLARAAEQARRDDAELDRILKKIADQGIDSLTFTEKRWLKRHTKERRQREGD